MFRRIIFALLLVCFISCGCAKKEVLVDDLDAILQRNQLIVGVRQDTNPFGYMDEDGVFHGYEVDIAKHIAKYLVGSEENIKFVPVTASNRMMKLGSREVDILIATMSITPQRQQILDFSIPYYYAGQAILVNSDSKAVGLRSFDGQKMIIVFGSTSERNLRLNVPEIKVIGYRTYKDAYKALKEKKAEGMIADDTILLGFTIKDKSVKLLPQRYSQEPYAIAFRKGPESQRLQNRINIIMDNIQQNGTLSRIQEKYGIRK